MKQAKMYVADAARAIGAGLVVLSTFGCQPPVKGVLENGSEGYFIDGNMTTYKEEQTATFLPFSLGVGRKNIMDVNVLAVQTGGIEYFLVDNSGKMTTMDSLLEEGSSSDTLEEVVVLDYSQRTEKRYKATDANDETLSGRHVKALFGHANGLYHKLRVKIREIKLGQYSSMLEALPK